MRVIGISVVRDEIDVIEASILHALRVLCDHVVVLDNGSTDGTWRKLSELARVLPLTIFRDAGPFDQSAMVTGLLHEVSASGPDWVLPFDADEFWWSSPRKPREVLASVPRDVGVLSSPVVNFVAKRRSLRRDPANLLGMRYRVRRDWAGRQEVLAGSASFVELSYPPKVLLRPSMSAVIGPGNHTVRDHDGATAQDHPLRCLHAPLRSFADLERRSHLRDRHIPSARSPAGTGGWQFDHWQSLRESQHLRIEWVWNSQEGGRLGRPEAPRLTRDRTLFWLVRRAMRFRSRHRGRAGPSPA